MAPYLSPEHLAHLAASNISEELALAAGLYTEDDPSRIRRILNWRGGTKKLGPCLVIPYTEDGDGYSRIRPTHPITEDRDGKTRARKYEQPKGRESGIYYPHWAAPEVFEDKTRPLWIVEGEKKALCLIAQGVPALALPGIWQGTRKIEGAHVLHPELETILRMGWEHVTICFDADFDTNDDLPMAMATLITCVEGVKKLVSIQVALPPGPEKGIDDFVVAKGWSRAWTHLISHKWSPRDPVARIAELDGEDRPKAVWRAARLARHLYTDRHFRRWLDSLAAKAELDPDEVRAWAEDGDLGDRDEEVEPTDSEPWTLTIENGDRGFHLSNGLKLPGGCTVLRRKSETAIAQYMISRWERPLAFYQGTFWSYAGGAWSPVDPDELRYQIAALDGEKDRKGRELLISDRSVEGIIKCMGTNLKPPSTRLFEHARDGVAFADRSVVLAADRKSLEIVEHDPAHGLRVWVDGQIPDDDALDCEPWWTNLVEITGGEAEARLVEEWVGIALLGQATKYQKVLWLQGPKGGGKSTLAEAIARLWPEELGANISLQDLSIEYSRASLATAAINWTTEVDADRLAVAAAKAIVTGDRTRARNPYGRNFFFRPTCAHLWASNKLPGVADSSGAWHSRVLLVRCDRGLRDTDRQDPYYVEQLIAQRPAIAWRCLQASLRVLKAGRFTLPERCAEALSRWEIESDAIRAWMDEVGVVLSDNHRENVGYTYSRYRRWAELTANPLYSSRKFSQLLQQIGVKSGSDGARRWVGLKLPNEDREYEMYGRHNGGERYDGAWDSSTVVIPAAPATVEMSAAAARNDQTKTVSRRMENRTATKNSA